MEKSKYFVLESWQTTNKQGVRRSCYFSPFWAQFTKDSSALKITAALETRNQWNSFTLKTLHQWEQLQVENVAKVNLDLSLNSFTSYGNANATLQMEAAIKQKSTGEIPFTLRSRPNVCLITNNSKHVYDFLGNDAWRTCSRGRVLASA